MNYFESCTKEQLLNCIYGEFNATEESVERDVQYLEEWMRQQPFLPEVHDKNQIVTFLLRGKFQLEKTKKLIERYYITRALMPQVFTDRDPYAKVFDKIIKVSPYVMMKKLTPEGYRVIVTKIFEHKEEDVFSEETFLKGQQMMSDMFTTFDRHKGIIFVVDVRNISLAYVRLMMTSLKRYAELALTVTPLRIHKIYILNMIPIAEVVMKLAKMVMKKKIFDRIEFWSGTEQELATVLPKECLPVEYGGSDKTLEAIRDEWVEYFRSKADWFTADENIKADLSKRTTEQSFGDNEFGVEGSFRKIALD